MRCAGWSERKARKGMEFCNRGGPLNVLFSIDEINGLIGWADN